MALELFPQRLKKKIIYIYIFFLNFFFIFFFFYLRKSILVRCRYVVISQVWSLESVPGSPWCYTILYSVSRLLTVMISCSPLIIKYFWSHYCDGSLMIIKEKSILVSLLDYKSFIKVTFLSWLADTMDITRGSYLLTCPKTQLSSFSDIVIIKHCWTSRKFAAFLTGWQVMTFCGDVFWGNAWMDRVEKGTI